MLYSFIEFLCGVVLMFYNFQSAPKELKEKGTDVFYSCFQ